jgi:hypothetical protein
MQLKLQIFLLVGKRFIPSETPKRLLLTGPNIISSKRNVAIMFAFKGAKLIQFAEYSVRLLRLPISSGSSQ